MRGYESPEQRKSQLERDNRVLRELAQERQTRIEDLEQLLRESKEELQLFKEGGDWKTQFLKEMALLIPKGYARPDEALTMTIVRWANEMSTNTGVLRQQNTELCRLANQIGVKARQIELGIWP